MSSYTPSKTLVFAAVTAAVAALAVVLLYRTEQDQDGAEDEHDNMSSPEDSPAEEDAKDDGSEQLIVIDTNIKARKARKSKKKRSKMKAGFLNALGGDGIDSPVSRKRKIVESKSAAMSPVAVEDEIIAQFISVSKQMQDLSALQGRDASDQKVIALQRRRMSLVASLKGIRGQASLARLESRLQDLSPPPPPPEPAELYRQSIAHRIMTDPNFQIEKEEPTGIKLEVQKTVRRAYWDSIRSRLATGDAPDIADTLADLTSQIIAGVLSLREDSPKFQQGMSKLISERVDLAFLRDQAAQGLLTLDSFAAVVRELTAIIGQCQSPERDSARKAWLSSMMELMEAGSEEVAAAIEDAEDSRIAQTMRLVEIIEPIFDGLFEMIETTKRDLVNYQIKMMRAHLTRDGKGVEYQRQKFQARLSAGEISLKRTRAFLAHGLKVAQTLPGLEKDSKMIDPGMVSSGSANVCRHLLSVSIVEHVYSNCAAPTSVVAGATAANTDGGGTPSTESAPQDKLALPETFDTEGIAFEKMRKSVFSLVEATTCFLKVNQFTLSVLCKPALSATEKASLYDFFVNHSRSLDQLESVKEVEVPVEATNSKKMLLVTRMDPNGKKLRRVRLEAGAIFSADLLKKRCEMTPALVSRLEELFYQLEENPSTDAVFKATSMILRNATLRAIEKALSSKGRVDADVLVQSTAGRSPLGLPRQALADFGKVLQAALQLSARNFEIHMDTYKEIVMGSL